MKLVEERKGQGLLTVRGIAAGNIEYSIRRFQAMTAAGLPVPGLHRIEGQLALDSLATSLDFVSDMKLQLDLEDGRRLDLTLLDLQGKVLAEGHGPGKCGCC